MKGIKNVFLMIFIWLMVIGGLVYHFTQMQSYANTINSAGILRGGTQRVIMLELCHTPDDELIQRVDQMLQALLSTETEHGWKTNKTQDFIDKLLAVQQKWQDIKVEIPTVRGGGSGQRLLMLSEEHFQLADATVYAAQRRAEQDLLYSVSAVLLLFMTISAFIAYSEYRNRKELRNAFYVDPLTGRDNAQAFSQKAAAALKGALPKSYLLVYTNMRNFKFVNQSYGHRAGDRLVCLMSDALLGSCAQGELCAHLNADHFVLLLHNTKNAPLRIRNALDAVLLLETEINFSEIVCSDCGVYEISDANESVKAMISKATIALTQGKQTECIAFYDHYLRQKLTREALLAQHMHSALERQEFQVYLQPKVVLATDRLSGVEALCRWNSETLGMLPPDEFIPLFEKNGFIVTLDFYMLEQVCAGWAEKGRGWEQLPVSVNFSRVTLLQDDFTQRFTNIVARHHMPHSLLEIEVTESAFIVEENTMIRILEELKDQGFRIVMDDFGLGYSSLNLLRKLPIDVLKIDKSFLRESTANQRARHIITCIIQMVGVLGIEVVCEGVETAAQVDMLRELGCQVGQGFYYSRPIPRGEFWARYDAYWEKLSASDQATPIEG